MNSRISYGIPDHATHISEEFASRLRVLAGTAHEKPLFARTNSVAVPGRLPLCHQLFTEFTSQPKEYLSLAEEVFQAGI